MQDAPISRINLLICRNTLMYFNAETQLKILNNFHFAVKDDGVLFLGKGEMLLTHSRLFAPIELKQRIFRKTVDQKVPRHILARGSDGGQDGRLSPEPDPWLRDAAFDSNPVAQLVLDADSRLVLANSPARAQFGIRTVDLGRPFQDFQISYEPADLRSRIDEARSLRQPVINEGVRWGMASGETRYLRIEVVPLFGGEDDIEGIIVTLIDISQNKILQLELERARQDLETAHEELESTVEEVETTNEELQSTNEELETMNEELQSTNEELETINAEIRARTTELDDVNAFLESILTSLRVGVVVVDLDFQVQIWNSRTADMWGLRANEVVGGHFLNLDIGLPVEQLRGPIRECLSQEAEAVQVMLSATNRVGKQITCKVTCMPLTGNDSRVRGVIMLMEALAASSG